LTRTVLDRRTNDQRDYPAVVSEVAWSSGLAVPHQESLDHDFFSQKSTAQQRGNAGQTFAVRGHDGDVGGEDVRDEIQQWGVLLRCGSAARHSKPVGRRRCATMAHISVTTPCLEPDV